MAAGGSGLAGVAMAGFAPQHAVSHLNRARRARIFNVSAAAIPSGDDESRARARSHAAATRTSSSRWPTRASRAARACCGSTVAYWHGDVLRLPLPRGLAPPLPVKVQLFDKDWKDDDLLGTSRDLQLNRRAARPPCATSSSARPRDRQLFVQVGRRGERAGGVGVSGACVRDLSAPALPTRAYGLTRIDHSFCGARSAPRLTTGGRAGAARVRPFIVPPRRGC